LTIARAVRLAVRRELGAIRAHGRRKADLHTAF
jgi:hypothetical protein